jgi:hypothetical protein
MLGVSQPKGLAMIRFKKIKINSEGKINLQWEHFRGSGNPDSHSLETADAADPEFYKAMEDLAEEVQKLCELPNEDLSRITVKGVSFSYAGDNETPGAVITASKTLLHSHTPLNLNTPHKPFEPYAKLPDGCEIDLKGVHTDDCIKKLKTLMNKAEDYLNGKRKQTDLFNSAKSGSDSK